MQTLKAEVRDRIVDSAREEFLEKGIDKANMREIAGKSQMTVGNLYRYFKSKDELHRFVVQETLREVDELVMRKTSNTVSFRGESGELRLSPAQCREILDSLGDELIDIYSRHRAEFSILMMHSRLNDEITQWVSGLLEDIIGNNYGISSGAQGLAAISHCYAVSAFAGLRDLMVNSGLKTEDLKLAVRIFFRSMVNALSADLSSYIEN